MEMKDLNPGCVENTRKSKLIEVQGLLASYVLLKQGTPLIKKVM